MQDITRIARKSTSRRSAVAAATSRKICATVAMLHVSRFTFWRTTFLLPRIQFAHALFVFPTFAFSGFAFAFFLSGL